MSQHQFVKIRAKTLDQLLRFCAARGLRVLGHEKLLGDLWRVKMMRAN